MTTDGLQPDDTVVFELDHLPLSSHQIKEKIKMADSISNGYTISQNNKPFHRHSEIWINGRSDWEFSIKGLRNFGVEKCDFKPELPWCFDNEFCQVFETLVSTAKEKRRHKSARKEKQLQSSDTLSVVASTSWTSMTLGKSIACTLARLLGRLLENGILGTFQRSAYIGRKKQSSLPLALVEGAVC